MTDTNSVSQTPTQAERAIYAEAKAGRQAAQRLLPLLRLIEDEGNPSGDDPTAQVIRILEAIVSGLRTIDQRTEAILAIVSKISPRPA